MSEQGPEGRVRRGGQVAFAVVMAIAVLGFFVGIDDGVPQAEPVRRAVGHTGAERTDDPGRPMPATAYAELRTKRIGANAEFRSRVEDMRPAVSTPDAAVEERAKGPALEARAVLRAFQGAPPYIPHEADQMTSTACLSCHRTAFELAGQRASGVPHPHFSNCLQCHAPGSPLEAPFALAASSFRGLASPTGGTRAWEGAPPTLPHTTWMRESCNSCHGLLGPEGLRTSHPERVMCLQCHAPSADLNHEPGGAPAFLSAVSR